MIIAIFRRVLRSLRDQWAAYCLCSLQEAWWNNLSNFAVQSLSPSDTEIVASEFDLRVTRRDFDQSSRNPHSLTAFHGWFANHDRQSLVSLKRHLKWSTLGLVWCDFVSSTTRYPKCGAIGETSIGAWPRVYKVCLPIELPCCSIHYHTLDGLDAGLSEHTGALVSEIN